MSSSDNNKISYKKLCPNDHIVNSKYAFDALRHAINDRSILNIAVTAPYGAGKSSVIKSFFSAEKNLNDKALYISLACFNDPYFKDKSYRTNNANVDETSLENSILQQLFFREPVHKLPWSNYFRIKNYKRDDLVQILLVLLLGLAALVKFGYFEKVNNFFSNSFGWLNSAIPNCFQTELFSAISSCFFISAFILFLYFAIRKTILFVKKIQSIKLNCAVGELEIQKKLSSPLDDKIDEILYFFETTNYDYIIFEDLDRFESKKIFIKLRELNKLINGYKELGDNEDKNPRRIKFIYALNDDIFSSRDRVKFFDFIVPIIPKISRSNVGDFFLSQKKDSENIVGCEQKLLDQLDKEVINDLGYYIDDLRLLNNIQNEFFIYCKSYYSQEMLNSFFTGKRKANTKELTELFCLILYKNLYPADFKKCHFGEGILYNFFHLEETIIEYFYKKTENIVLGQAKYSLQEIAQHFPNYIKEFLNSKETAPVDFLISFVSRGLITEKYYSFISHFYPGDLSYNDFNLVKAMKNTSIIGFEDKIDNVKLVLDKLSKNTWNSNAILNKYIFEYICENNQEEYIHKFITSLFSHDQSELENQYLKKYASILFNKKTVPIIAETIEWANLPFFFDEQNLYAFWDLIGTTNAKQNHKIAGKIRYFFKKLEKVFCSENNIRQTLTHQDLMQYYSMKISDISLINDNKQLKRIIQKNLLELNKKNIHALYPNLTGNFISYNILKRNRDLFSCINKNINDFVENIILTNYCKLTAADISRIILNPYMNKANVWRLVSLIEPDFIDISMINPHQYDPKAEYLNVHGIKALIEHNKLDYNDNTITLLKLKYNITLKQKQPNSPEVESLKKAVKKESDPSIRATIIENYINQNQLQNNPSVIEYAIRVFLHTEKNIVPDYFASKLINDHFDYVKSILSNSRAEGLSTQFFTTQLIDQEKREEMLQLVNFPEKIISLHDRIPQKAKYLFERTEHLISDKSLPDIYRHVFNKEIPESDDNKISYKSLRKLLKESDWGRI